MHRPGSDGYAAATKGWRKVACQEKEKLSERGLWHIGMAGMFSYVVDACPAGVTPGKSLYLCLIGTHLLECCDSL